ncbi:hypothetical protein CALCODRAFT_157666 [Calocera cornea HHB12733]|uniref:Uncharacterized protein n=1 Tax=Calocera cornea HHB12733 TaxID=1353952 RepID=A0A165I0E0_9BASI|nr:hypothetical protein CALCODRAFT_157666 [Calocera cornea HHB12733]
MSSARKCLWSAVENMFALLLRTALAALDISSAAALALARAGPSGQVLSPEGGRVLGQQDDVLRFVYQPVTESTNPGYATAYVNLFIWDQDGCDHSDRDGPELQWAVRRCPRLGSDHGRLELRRGRVLRQPPPAGRVGVPYQTGARAPADGFQSAAPSFSIVDCYTIQARANEAPNTGSLLYPPEGAVLGLDGDSALIAYEAEQQVDFIPYSIDVDIQPSAAAIQDEHSWTTVIHHFSSPSFQPGTANFNPVHWGYLGDVRFRVISYGVFVDVWFKAVFYRNATVVDED